jgi:hypothetical protein
MSAQMAAGRQDSESELAGRVAASLTPRVHTPLQQGGEQNSGLFDIGALYAASRDLATRRAQQARQPPRVIDAAAARAFSQPAPASIRPYEVEVEDVELLDVAGLPRRGRIGWFGVAVAWLVVSTLGLAVATGVPAHALRGKLAKPVAAALATLTPAPALTATATLTATPTPTATLTLILTATPTAPPVVAVAATPIATDTPKPRPAAPAHPRASAAVRIVPTEAPLAAPAPAPVAKTTVSSASNDVPPTPKPATVPAATPAAAPAAASLEDLMRQAVQNDAKHH